MLEFSGLRGLTWSCTSILNFWLLGLAAMHTEKTSSGGLGWICGDTELAWFAALERVALNLIRQYAVMCVDVIESEIFRIPLRDVLRAVSTFEGRFNELITKRKALLVIADVPVDLSHADLTVHEYDLDSEFVLPSKQSANSSPSTTPPSNTRACADFVNIAIKNEQIYAQIAQNEEAAISK